MTNVIYALGKNIATRISDFLFNKNVIYIVYSSHLTISITESVISVYVTKITFYWITIRSELRTGTMWHR